MANNPDDDLPAGFLRQRRNLLVFSVGILLYVIGEGTIERVPAISVPVKLQNLDVAIWFALIGFAYSIWRYWLYSQDVRTRIKMDHHSALFRHQYYLNLAREKQGPVDQNKLMARPKIRRIGRRFSMDFSQGWHNEFSLSPKGKGGNPQVDLSYKEVLRIYAPTFWWVLASKKAFSDYVLPYLFALAAIGAILYRYFSLPVEVVHWYLVQ